MGQNAAPGFVSLQLASKTMSHGGKVGGFENRCTRNSTGGSNPSPSASQSVAFPSLLYRREN